MARILSFTNPVTYSSGYAVQAYHLMKVLQMMGHKIFMIDCAIPINNTQKVFNIHQIRKMYEAQHPEFCANIDERMDVLKKITFLRYFGTTFPCELDVKDFNAYIDEFNIDYMLFFIDIWIIKATEGPKFNCTAITWLPIHFEPVEIRTIQAAELFDTIVCLGSDGEDKIRKLFPHKTIARVPHIIDFTHYDLSPIDKPEVRKSMNIPVDCYLVTMIFNNSETTNRKCFCANLLAFKKFHTKHPNSRLYIHSKLDGALNLDVIIDYFEISRDSIIVSDPNKVSKGGYSFEWMVKLFKVTDCLLAATSSEGFGIPILEAGAVGTPVVATNTTAMPDNVYNGELAAVYQMKFCLQNTSYWAVPDVDSIVACLDKVYNRSPEERHKKARWGMKCVRENYNLKTLYDGWKPLISKEPKPIQLPTAKTVEVK